MGGNVPILSKNIFRGYKRSAENRGVAVLNLLRFIDWIMALPEEMERSLNEKIAEYQEENKMRYVTSFQRIGYRKRRISFLIVCSKNVLELYRSGLRKRCKMPLLKNWKTGLNVF